MHVIRYASPPSSAIPGQGGHYGEPRPALTSLSSVGSLGSLGTLGSGSDAGGGGTDTPTGTDSPHVRRGERQPPAATTAAHPHAAAPDHADHAQYTRKLERAVRLLHERTSQVEAQLAAAMAQAAQAQAAHDMPSPATTRPLPPASPAARPAGACVRVCEHCVTSAHHVYSHRALKTAMTSRRHAANAAP